MTMQYRMDAADGSHEKLASSSWLGTGAAVYVGGNKVFVLHRDGIYRVDATDGSHEKLENENCRVVNWGSTTGAVYVGGYRILVLLSGSGMYHIDTRNGSYSKLASSSWPDTSGMVAVRDSPSS